jgi:hypothetical protein
MARSEQHFIDLCKKQIEQKFSFGNGSGYTLVAGRSIAGHDVEVGWGEWWKHPWKDNPVLKRSTSPSLKERDLG